jgi:hypothetical protein
MAPVPRETIMLLSSATTVPGIFDNREQAKQAIQALKDAGFTDAQIAVASREWSKKLGDVGVEEQHLTERGAVAGALVGGGIGAALGLVGAILVPGAIPIITGSVFLSALGGGLAGAGGGAFAGPFIALGFSEEESQKHAHHVQAGKTVLLVHAPGRQEEARNIMTEKGAFDESMNAGP